MKPKISGPAWTGIILSLIAILATFLLFLGLIQWQFETPWVEGIRNFIGAMGWGGVPVYIVFFIIGSFLFASATALSAIAPALFGPWVGFVAILTGNLAAAASMFALTRWAGYRWAFHQRVQSQFLPEGLIRLARGQGFRLVLFARLLMFPASLVNYTAAFLPISFYKHLLGTFLGIFSHCLSTALSIGILRDAFLAGQWSLLMRWETGLLAVAYAVTLIASYFIKVRIDQQNQAEELLRDG
jgi:uncharacterized membrane protein YdjX (TVP38/TMEM64 family)